MQDVDLRTLGNNAAGFNRTLASLPSMIVHGSYVQEGNVRLHNYELLWKLPLCQGSWAALVRAPSSVVPVKVIAPQTWNQVLRIFFFQFVFVKGCLRKELWKVVLDTLLGFDDVYYCM